MKDLDCQSPDNASQLKEKKTYYSKYKIKGVGNPISGMTVWVDSQIFSPIKLVKIKIIRLSSLKMTLWDV